jgi:riboflavin kinase/FMN adenylyltransferase
LKVYTDINSFQGVQKPVLTIGTFDGVHCGHQVILDRLAQIAETEDGETVLLTFDPHPRTVLFPEANGLKLLNTKKEKIDLLEKSGLDHLIIYPFTQRFSRLNSVEYVRDVLVNGVGVHKMVSGYDHHFGRNREGDLDKLRELSELYGFGVEEISAQMIDEVKISSTKIRRALVEGDVATAASYLGYSYTLSGKVEQGNSLGRTIGFPTANLLILDRSKLIPGNGVYAIEAEIKGVDHRGMMNIGNRPTVNGDTSRTVVEAHLFDVSEDLYGDMMTVRFVARLRNEERFEDLNALKEQLHKDRQHALDILQ